MDSNTSLARQKILDKNGSLVAYELLFRSSPERVTAVMQNDLSATASVLENALSGIGLSTLLGNCKGFVNCSREMLLGNLTTILEPGSIVLEILEDVYPDEQIMSAINKLHAKGFEFALDDFVFTPKNCELFWPYFKYLSCVKIDLVENSLKARAEAALYFQKMGIKTLAEKVETEEEFLQCKEEGFDYFQGFYFSHPEVVIRKQISAKVPAILSLLRLLRYAPSLDTLTKEFFNFPEVSAAFLHYLENSLDSESEGDAIRTMRSGLERLGLKKLHTWLMMLLLSRSLAKENAFRSPLYKNISHKAKFMENLALFIAPNHPNLFADAFLVGVLSRMEDFADVPVEKALKEIEVAPEVYSAIVEYKGPLGQILSLANAVEKGSDTLIEKWSNALSLKKENVDCCLQEASLWVAYE